MDRANTLVTLIGGSGFLGTQVVQLLARKGYRIRVAVRRPDLAGHLKPLGAVGQIQPIQANIRNADSVMRAVQGAQIVINLVGIRFERGRQMFRAVHTMGARTVAEAARRAGVETLVHLSALGADAQSASSYARSKALGVYGTKERSVVNAANRAGIAAIVKQQFEVGQQVLAAGLMPILEPEVNIKSADRAQSDQILKEEILKALDAMPGTDKVMLKLSIPAQPGLFDALVDHPRVLRVVALSGGYSRADACTELAKNRGMIASFSRALLEDLRAQMSEAEFDAALGEAIGEIYEASTDKVAA